MIGRTLSTSVMVSAIAGLLACSGQPAQSSKETQAAQPAQPAATAAAEKPASKLVFGVSNSFIGSEWRAQMIREMQDAAKELGAELVVESADTDVQGQTQQIHNLINKGVKAIVINPGDVKGLNPALEEATAQGITVIAVDQAIEAKGVYNAVIDQKEWAMRSAKWLADKLSGKGNITEIEGFVGHPANEARMAGVAEVLKGFPKMKVIARDTGKWDPATAQKVAANFLTSVPHIDGMWTQDGMAEGQLLALKAANPAKWPVVVGEARASFLRVWKKTIGEHQGFETVGVINPPAVGAAGIRIAYNLVSGKKTDPSKLGGPNKNTFFVPIPDVVTNANLDDWLKKIEGQPDSYTLDADVNQALADSFFQK
jgi:ribose transport system substrate-binding protein